MSDADSVFRHPGEVLAQELTALGMSGNALADALSVPPPIIAEILTGRREINEGMARQLTRIIDKPSTFWLRLQGRYEGRRG